MRWMRDSILVLVHLCRTSTVQCGTHTRVFCRTQRRTGPLTIPTCVLASVFSPFAFYTIGHKIKIKKLKNNNNKVVLFIYFDVTW